MIMKHLHLKYISSILILVIFGISCNQKKDLKQETTNILDISNIPFQPEGDNWEFIDELKSPMWTKHQWKRVVPGPEQADLSKGVIIKRIFPDPKNRLETVYDDLNRFLEAGNISTGGDYVIETILSDDLEGEAFRLEISKGGCRIVAGDVEGIRRGIFHLEDEMLSLRSALLPLGKIERQPFVKRRISRCVYGPIKRPPSMRDELMDSVDYYPDQYLNRLAHEGVNGLWITVDFRDLVSTKFTPEAGKDSKRRLDKLRRTVAQCLRYGIRTYIFTIEPRAWGNMPPYYHDIDVLDHYPEMGGTRSGNIVWFCPISKTSQEYLYQAVNGIFREVPGLGGMINISYNERETTCINEVDENAQLEGQINCPRCKDKQPWEIIHASLTAMEKGMHDADPDAELISWLYMGVGNYADWVYDIAAHTPEGVILQLQFETGVTRTEFGKKLVGGDYWLSTPGPSQAFERQAVTARENETTVSAKLQTGNSHEVASIPYVPVPSMVYRKLSAMHRLGVSHAMLGWYFGNYPGPMIKSSGMLSFEPFPENEVDFLNKLASVYWKEDDVPAVVDAWKKLAEGYGNYPLQNKLGYYGPMHDGPVWPLLLKPLDAPLSPTWQIGSSASLKPWPPSGDRIGECLFAGGIRIDRSLNNVLTLEETVELCRRMSTIWNEGVSILEKLEPDYRNEPERVLEIGVAKALLIQFRSGYNILHFYQLREEMLRMEGRERLDILEQMGTIIKEELEGDEQLIRLCEADSRLGFHSEAEGYKYFPEKIRWRMKQLRNVLNNDVPYIRKQILDGELLFPEYTGMKPSGDIAYAVPSGNSYNDLQWKNFGHGVETSSKWATSFNEDTLFFIISDSVKSIRTISEITIKLEPRRLWPNARFVFNTGGRDQMDPWITTVEKATKKYFVITVPFNTFWWSEEESHPLRIDVRIRRKDTGTSSWRPENPLTSRLVYGTDNPADLGWLIFR